MPEYYNLTPEREKAMVERIARFIAKSDIRDFLKIALKTYGLSNFFGNLGFMFSYPYATGLLGDFGQDFTELMGLNPVGSAQRILQRVEELEVEEKSAPEKEVQKGNHPETGIGRPSLLRRLFSFLIGRASAPFG